MSTHTGSGFLSDRNAGSIAKHPPDRLPSNHFSIQKKPAESDTGRLSILISNRNLIIKIVFYRFKRVFNVLVDLLNITLFFRIQNLSVISHKPYRQKYFNYQGRL